MMTGVGAHFPPYRLRAVNDRWHAWLRPAWFAVLALTLFLDLAGAVYVVHDSFVSNVAFARLGLNSQVQNDGSAAVSTPPGRAGPALPEGTRIASIDGAAVPYETRIWNLAKQLERREGSQLWLGLILPDGKHADRTFRNKPKQKQKTNAGRV